MGFFLNVVGKVRTFHCFDFIYPFFLEKNLVTVLLFPSFFWELSNLIFFGIATGLIKTDIFDLLRQIILFHKIIGIIMGVFVSFTIVQLFH